MEKILAERAGVVLPTSAKAGFKVKSFATSVSNIQFTKKIKQF